MSFFKRLLSSNYRQALALEGSGRYREAAQKYLLSGERLAAARMHRLAARDEDDPYLCVETLRKAIHTLEGTPLEDDDLRALTMIRRELADALVKLVDQTGFLDRRDRAYLEEAASIYTKQNFHDESGEVFARLGFLHRAAESFQAAGNISRMEEMFQQSEVADLSEAEFDRAWDAFEFAKMADDPVGAIEALARCAQLRSHDAGLLSRLQKLRERMPPCGRITLQSSQGQWVLCGGQTIGLGREDNNEILLLEPSVSRDHARITARGGKVVLEDLGSSHGTFLDDTQVRRSAPLRKQGELRVGREVLLRYQFRQGRELPAFFEIAAGQLKGQKILWANRILTTGIPPDEPPWLPPGLALGFQRGYWHLLPEACEEPVQVQGKALTAPRLLRLRDEITFHNMMLTVA